jgi:hypothetical protein
MLRAAHIVVIALLLAGLPAMAQEAATGGEINTIKDLHHALGKCWIWPSQRDSSGHMDLTVMLSFHADGELFGGRITHVSRDVSDNERDLYFVALETMVRRCARLPMSRALGAAIAGRPFIFRITDTRNQKRA